MREHDRVWVGDDAVSLYKSSARRAALSLTARYEEAATGRDMRGRFLPRFAGGGRCDRIGCDDRIEASGARFCATHRAEHGARLRGQLEAIVGDPS